MRVYTRRYPVSRGDLEVKNEETITEIIQENTRKILELINEFDKFSGYKINTQKSLTFLYTKNKRSERVVKKLPHLPLQQKE